MNVIIILYLVDYVCIEVFSMLCEILRICIKFKRNKFFYVIDISIFVIFEFLEFWFDDFKDVFFVIRINSCGKVKWYWKIFIKSGVVMLCEFFDISY